MRISYLVLGVQKEIHIKIDGKELITPITDEEGVEGFMLVFTNHEDALDFAMDPDLVVPIEIEDDNINEIDSLH